MTREELEKKRGKKLPKRAASAAESLIIKDDGVDDVTKGDEIKNTSVIKSETPDNTESGIKTVIVSDVAIKENTDDLKSQKKKEVMEHLSLRLPKQTLKDLDVVKYVYGDVSKYVRHLIDKDLKENMQTYVEKRAIIRDVINR